MVVQRLVAPEGLECKLALAEGAEERMALGMPAVANLKDLIGYRSHRHMIHIRGHGVLRNAHGAASARLMRSASRL